MLTPSHPLIGRTVRLKPPHGETTPPAAMPTGTVQAVAWDAATAFWLLVLNDGGDLVTWYVPNCDVLPEAPSVLGRLVPAWSRRHLPEALAGAAVLALVATFWAVL